MGTYNYKWYEIPKKLLKDKVKATADFPVIFSISDEPLDLVEPCTFDFSKITLDDVFRLGILYNRIVRKHCDQTKNCPMQEEKLLKIRTELKDNISSGYEPVKIPKKCVGKCPYTFMTCGESAVSKELIIDELFYNAEHSIDILYTKNHFLSDRIKFAIRKLSIELTKDFDRWDKLHFLPRDDGYFE